jgi:N-acetylglucosaminyldiphosphoundecaprenol N-acetyl-beta-D-mannosaminyltransferase
LKQSPPPSEEGTGNHRTFIKASVLGIRVDLGTPEEIFAAVRSYFSSKKFCHIITSNALMVLDAINDPGLKKTFDEAHIVIPESSGIEWALRKKGVCDISRMAGIDVALKLCAIAQDMRLPVYLFGGAPGVAERASHYLTHQFPSLSISGTRHGFISSEEDKSVILELETIRPCLVLLGLGSPRQESWISNHREQLPPAVYMGVGGSFDVWAGDVKRAPMVLQKFGLEWAYRVMKEPFRWKRILRLPIFVGKVWMEKLQS